MGHIKGGNFIIGLSGKKEYYNIMLELLCLKSSELTIDKIEVNVSGFITDSSFSNDLDYMIENLFEMQEYNKKVLKIKEEIDPNDLEFYVINAIQKELLTTRYQGVYESCE